MFVPFFTTRKLGRRSKIPRAYISPRDEVTGGSFSFDTHTVYGVQNATLGVDGGGQNVTVSNGFPFAGRSAGGGTRNEIYGTEVYGSGYPNLTGRGTAGRGFPFYFWPVVWSDGPDYLHPSEFYGTPDNSSRPGGALATATFSSTSDNTTFQILSDEDTVTLLTNQITGFCFDYVQGPSMIRPAVYNTSSSIKPEQAVQYYRASSVVLTLDGYNNTAALSTNESAVRVPLSLSSNGTGFLDCANTTIGRLAPLVFILDASSTGHSNAGVSTFDGLTSSVVPTTGLVGLLWLALMVFVA